MEIRYPYKGEDLKIKQRQCDQRLHDIKIEGLDRAYDLAQIIKHLMIDRKPSYFVKADNQIQCTANRARTVEDLTVIANSYGIKISFVATVKAIEQLYSNPTNYLTHGFCSTVLREVHSPTNLTLTAAQIRVALGDYNVKNPNYAKTKKQIKTKRAS